MNTTTNITPGNIEEAYLCTCGETLTVKDRQNGGTTCTNCKIEIAAPITRRLDQKFGDVGRPRDDYEDYRP